MTQNNDPIGDALGITPLERNITTSGKLVLRKEEPGTDYEYGRQNLVDLIEKGKQVFGEFSEVAAAAQEPRHYEVLTNLLVSLIDAQEKLLNLKKKELEIEAAQTKNPEEDGGNITNNLFVGSTAEFQAMIKASREKKAADECD